MHACMYIYIQRERQERESRAQEHELEHKHTNYRQTYCFVLWTSQISKTKYQVRSVLSWKTSNDCPGVADKAAGNSVGDILPSKMVLPDRDLFSCEIQANKPYLLLALNLDLTKHARKKKSVASETVPPVLKMVPIHFQLFTTFIYSKTQHIYTNSPELFHLIKKKL